MVFVYCRNPICLSTIKWINERYMIHNVQANGMCMSERSIEGEFTRLALTGSVFYAQVLCKTHTIISAMCISYI